MNKVALVTGSSKGLGRSIIMEFAKSGYDVIINYNNSKSDAETLKEEVEKLYNIKAITIKCDISKTDEVINMKDIYSFKLF